MPNPTQVMPGGSMLLKPPSTPSRWYYPTGESFPATFPNLGWPSYALAAKYKFGILTILKPLPTSIPLKEEMGIFSKWCQQPYNFGETGSSGVVVSTYRGIENTVSKLIGVAFIFEHVELPYLSFHLFSNQVSWVIGSGAGEGAWEGEGKGRGLKGASVVIVVGEQGAGSRVRGWGSGVWGRGRGLDGAG